MVFAKNNRGVGDEICESDWVRLCARVLCVCRECDSPSLIGFASRTLSALTRAERRGIIGVMRAKIGMIGILAGVCAAMGGTIAATSVIEPWFAREGK